MSFRAVERGPRFRPPRAAGRTSAVRSPGLYFAESTRVLAAKYARAFRTPLPRAGQGRTQTNGHRRHGPQGTSHTQREKPAEIHYRRLLPPHTGRRHAGIPRQRRPRLHPQIVCYKLKDTQCLTNVASIGRTALDFTSRSMVNRNVLAKYVP